MEKEVNGIVYVILKIDGTKDKLFRVGSSKDLSLLRPKTQQSYLPFKTALYVFYSNDYKRLETDIHRKSRLNKLNGDWYSFNNFSIIEEIYKDESVQSVSFPSLHYILSTISKIVMNNGFKQLSEL